MDAQAGAEQDVSRAQAVSQIYKQHPLPVLTDPPKPLPTGQLFPGLANDRSRHSRQRMRRLSPLSPCPGQLGERACWGQRGTTGCAEQTRPAGPPND